ncbi:hypothetical protein H0B56_17350 [Haloechinothrix sp. YIM 98757]|uniref:DUF5753 domain-containing protein n=1 Tax=Haloechinothrix aidingensis TaxID=2752311 RepID=A0A838ADD3_9PSEU|nr:Scr1 family TA system antitoxin-like transcriptional regulator [Haloechinothrix aidingensis]MBA0127316.1 hypothetical protein [Haloechinothrix aidingensis]
MLLGTRRPALRFWCVLGKAALRGNIGGQRVMCEQLAHLIHAHLSMENVVIQILPLGSGPHEFMSMTATLDGFPPPATSVLVTGSYGRETFHEKPPEVTRAAHHLDPVKAMALGRDESTECLQRLHQERHLD